MTDLKQLLEQLGLENYEPQVYLTALRLGTSPASTIGKKADINRSSTRFTCEQLVKKQLMSISQKANTKLYTAEPPEKLHLLLDIQREALEKKQDQLDESIQELKQIYNPHVILPKVTFYEGKDGVIKLYEKILDLKSPIDSFEDKGEMETFIGDYFPKFIKKRVEREIFNRVICPATNEINISTPKEMRETRTVPVDEFPFSCDIKIAGDTVNIFSFDKNTPLAISINHDEIANNFRLLFQYFWKLLNQS